MMTTSEVEYELGHPCKQLDQIERGNVLGFLQKETA